MDALNIYKKFYEQWEELDFKLGEGSTSERATFQTEMRSAGNFKGSAYVDVIAFGSGTIHVALTFDHIDKNINTYELINDLNREASWAKGYITTMNGKTFFEMHYAYMDSKDEDEAVMHASHAINDVLSDKVLGYVAKITNLTY